MIRSLEPSEVAVAASLHAAALRDDLLSATGPALVETLYRCALEDRRSFVLTVGNPGMPQGIVLGSEDGIRLLRMIPASCPLGLVAGGINLLRRRGLSWVFDGLRGLVAPGPQLPKAEIVYYFVAGDCRGRGVGRALLDAAANEFHRRGIAAWHAKVDARNQAGKRSYAAAGGRPTGAFQHASRTFEAMIFS